MKEKMKKILDATLYALSNSPTLPIIASVYIFIILVMVTEILK